MDAIELSKLNDWYKRQAKKRKEIIEQGCCPNCYSPEPCSCEDDFNENFVDQENINKVIGEK